MGALDKFNDKWGNVRQSMSKFSSKHQNQEIIYSSAGALFKRKGDTPFKGWTIFLNRRGNVVISEKRSFFSNPAISGGSFYLATSMILFSAFIFIIAGFIFISVYLLFSSVIISAMCSLIVLPLVILLFLSIGLNIYQRMPNEYELDHENMKKMYLGKYNTLTGQSPMFSCYDGKDSYHFVGYKKLDEETSDLINKIYNSR